MAEGTPDQPGGCCHPGPASHAGPEGPAGRAPGRQTGGAARDVVALPAATVRLGDHWNEGYAADGELPVHAVSLGAFDIDRAPVTNAQFADFVERSGYVTQAERQGASAVFYLHARAADADVLGQASGAPWWLTVRGADWAHPTGPGSTWRDRERHPVVQVSWHDAVAYAAWAGRSLPSEAQWEYAARGGLDGARFAWGDDLHPGGRHVCNIWQGQFPVTDLGEDGFLGTSPVGHYPPNGFGLHDVAGNVWEWCLDAFAVDAYRRRAAQGIAVDPVEHGPAGASPGELERVIRGGSHLCHDSYCHRYRVAARSRATALSTSSNTGFRTVSAARKCPS
ncbi:MAG: formylglycine-generating enzyme family protein [Arthrobacter sp.]|nr:formylglycine-generating enzyme family protein [Arthrobacter sp.]